jgi:hypothetical protein
MGDFVMAPTQFTEINRRLAESIGPIKEDKSMNTVLILALSCLPGADPATGSGGMCACKATSASNVGTMTPVPAKPDKPLFPRLNAWFGKHWFHKDETPVSVSQPPVNTFNNFRSETVILPEPTTKLPANQAPTLFPSDAAPLPLGQSPGLHPEGAAPLPSAPMPTTAEPPLN